MEQQSNPKEEIKVAVQEIIDNPHDDTILHGRLTQIHGIFSELTKVTGLDQEMELMAAVPTAHGMALGLNHAAQCLLDIRRTNKFLQGMLKAIADIRQKKVDGPINVFYAGCGPYAPFISLVAPLFSPEELQFSLLEINEKSLETAKTLIQELGLEDFVMDYHQADAVTFKVEDAEQFDILFSETLDAVLYRECYVPILYNLLPQFKDDVVLIPENVRLELRYIHKTEDENAIREESPIATLVDVRQVISSHTPGAPIPKQLDNFPVDLINMEAYESILIDTTVQVYDTIGLLRGESSLTLPLEMKLEQPFPNSRITFNYVLEPQIELKYTLEHL